VSAEQKTLSNSTRNETKSVSRLKNHSLVGLGQCEHWATHQVLEIQLRNLKSYLLSLALALFCCLIYGQILMAFFFVMKLKEFLLNYGCWFLRGDSFQEIYIDYNCE
jgi:hypothetical protein